MNPILFLLVAEAALGQTASTDQTGGITGVVTDAVSHLPVKKTTVSVNGMSNMRGKPGGQAVVTDATGAFTINNLSPGQYRLVFQQQNYPQSRFGGVAKNEEVKAGQTAGPVTVELIPGAAISGRILDEDGDPLSACNVQLHQAKNPQRGVPVFGSGNSNENGEYRLYMIPPGKYILTARCSHPVFQPRLFSAGPEPPPTLGYPQEYFPDTADPKSAVVVELTPGAEKSGVDFQMRPASLTQVHVGFSPGGVDWHDNGPLMVRLVPFDSSEPGMGAFSAVDPKNGTYQFRQVFPGSYVLAVFSNSGVGNPVGVTQRVDVGNQPVNLVVELRHAVEVGGRIEIDNSGGNNSSKFTLSQVGIQLVPQYQIGVPGSRGQANDDGTFTMNGVLPAVWRVEVNAPFAFVKSVWFGDTNVTDAPIDLSNGAGGMLRIVMSTNTATIRGSAPAGQVVYSQRLDDNRPFTSFRGAQVEQTGQYKVENLAPGKYRLLVADSQSMPDEGGQEVTVHEGETLMVDLKPQPAP